MKAVILAGGLGTRLSEETDLKPKPMVEIGNKPIIWHIMKNLSYWGIKEFIICCGYKGHVIKQYFDNYRSNNFDIEVDLGLGETRRLSPPKEDWKVTLIDTGENTQTGGRLKRVAHLLPSNESFLFTYGDGLTNVDIEALTSFHKKMKRLATVTAVQLPGRFGSLSIENDRVSEFVEKRRGDQGYINGGFFILEPEAINSIKDDNTAWEGEPMAVLARTGELAAFKHEGFWQPMDTLRDKVELSKLWKTQQAPWRLWL